MNSLNNTAAYKRAKQIDEPYVKAALEEIGWKIQFGDYNEDFNHIDLKVLSTPKCNKVFSIDVKRSDRKNAYTPNFLITTISKTGRKFPFSPVAFFAFIDDEDMSISIIRQSKIEEIQNDSSLRINRLHSKFGIGEYLLINKNIVKERADKIIMPSESVKALLKWLD